MRNLALVLLLLNIVFLSWQLVLLPKQNKKNTENTENTENTINNHPKPIVATVATVPKKKPPICFQAGPYTDKEKVDELINILKNNKNINIKKLKVQTSQTRVLKSIWVYLPPFESKQAAKNAIKALKQAGFEDYMIMRKGRFKNIISLGFYNSSTYAEIRVKKLKSKGYKNIKTQKRYKDVTKYMLNVKMPANEQSLFVNFFKENFQEQLLELVACE